MFVEWGFLITEMVVLIIIAALLGLLVGWIVWGRRRGSGDGAEKLHADLDACKRDAAGKDGRISALEGELLVVHEKASKAEAAHAAVVSAWAADRDSELVDYDGDGALEGTGEGVKPSTLDAPRDGKADDLKQIKGIGPKLEALCNRLGFWHFDQIAAWTDDEVAWVDANLEGFKGRVSRDDWVAQAKVLATGGSTEFADRVKQGDVY